MPNKTPSGLVRTDIKWGHSFTTSNSKDLTKEEDGRSQPQDYDTKGEGRPIQEVDLKATVRKIAKERNASAPCACLRNRVRCEAQQQSSNYKQRDHCNGKIHGAQGVDVVGVIPITSVSET